ncbi:thermonuclease family protein [Niallia oryzisoli]|uniref:Thermonuclease family protein n=1 Tax=Niallia oryzisoli TaxID=1737571 RepID=A0ABZ2CIK2_9BACI
MDKAVNQIDAAYKMRMTKEAEKGIKKINAMVLFIPDGDTLTVRLDGKKETIRLLLVDSPESVHPEKQVQPYGKASCFFVRNLAPIGKEIQVELDVCERDKYGRLLAYVYIEGKMLNELLLEKGFARVAYVYPPNTRYVERFRKIERSAQKQGVGIWAWVDNIT